MVMANKDDKSKSSTSSDNRFVNVFGNIDEDKAKDTIERLLELQVEDPMSGITVVVNGLGGEIYSMFAITDTMDMVYPTVRTVCVGSAQSASSFIFLCGTRGSRFMSPHSGLMLHRVSAGSFGNPKDIDIHARHVKYLEDSMIKEIVKRSNMDEELVRKHIYDGDFHITPGEAVELGLCDGVIDKLS